MSRYIKSGTVNTVQEINSELEKIAASQTEFLARNGETPNAMKAALDMNSNRITNLPAAVNATDALRLIDLTGEYDVTVGIDETPVFDNIAVMTSSNLSVGQLVRVKREVDGGELVEGLLYEVQSTGVSNPPLTEALANGNFAKKLPSYSQTDKEQFYYVDSTLGTDSLGNGYDVATPCKTLQYAWDLIPTVVRHQQTIQLADGVYNENNLPSNENPRPAVLVGRNKVTTFRSTLSGSVLSGAITIQGNAADRTAVKITTSPSLTYGIYVNKGNIAIRNLSIESDGINSVSSLLTAHRTDTYIHAANVLIDGKSNTTYGALTESSGQMELSDDCDVEACTVGVATLTDGDNLVLSGSSKVTNCGTGALAKNGHVILSMTDGALSSSTMIGSCTLGIRCTSGTMEIRGLSATNRVLIDSPIIVENNSSLVAIFTDIDSTTTLTESSSIKLDNSGFQNSLIARASDVSLRSSNSYISAGTPNNDVALPIALINGSRIQYDGTNNIVGSGGGYTSYNPQDLVVNADSEVLTLSTTADVFRVNGNGANRVLCSFSATDVEEGRVVYVYGDTWNVGFTSGTTMDVGADFSIGNAALAYTGANFTFRSGKWHLLGLGQVR